MCRFKKMYLDTVDIILMCIHFLRTRNQYGYLEVMFECFKLNRQNFARNLNFCMRIEKPISTRMMVDDGGCSGSLSGRPNTRILVGQVMTINMLSKDNHLMVAMRQHLNKRIRKITKE